METSPHDHPFQQYTLNPATLPQLPQREQKDTIETLIQGCLLRNQLKLYRGDKAFIIDLQVILDHDRVLAPVIFKLHKIMLNQDANTVLNQCVDCGKFMQPFRYCEGCEHAHYCSEGCQVRSQLGHQSSCRGKGKGRRLPAVETGLQVEVHVGGGLGRELEVYFQHQMRMSLRVRGEALIRQLFDHFIGEGKASLPDDCRA